MGTPNTAARAEAEVAAAVAFAHVPQIGPRRTRRLVEALGSLEAAWSAPADRLTDAIGVASAEAVVEVRRRLDVGSVVARALELGTVLVRGAPGYPAHLLRLDDPPFALFARGDLDLLSMPCVAVVGTRSPSRYGRETAGMLASGLAECGYVVVSGLAEGVDGAAHRAALEVQGRTVAVLGNGLDVTYPAAHRGLQARIGVEGALLTEHPPGTPPVAGHFPRRNRIVAALGEAVVVVEAPHRSGALITAALARELGVDVLAVPGRICDNGSVGTNALIAAGAGMVRSVRDVVDAVSLVRLFGESDAASPAPEANADPAAGTTAGAVLAAIRDGCDTADAVIRRTGLESGPVSRALTLLELDGRLEHVGTTYRLAER